MKVKNLILLCLLFYLWFFNYEKYNSVLWRTMKIKASDKIGVVREKSDFVEVSKNLARHRSGYNFIRSSK